MLFRRRHPSSGSPDLAFPPEGIHGASAVADALPQGGTAAPAGEPRPGPGLAGASERLPARSPGGGRTVIGPQTRIRGTLSGDGSVIVRGVVQGGIAIGGGLTVEESGSVEADVEAQSVAIAGQARGSITATTRVVLSTTGVFEGRLATPVLDLRPGAVLQGRARILGAPAPDRRRLSH